MIETTSMLVATPLDLEMLETLLDRSCTLLGTLFQLGPIQTYFRISFNLLLRPSRGIKLETLWGESPGIGVFYQGLGAPFFSKDWGGDHFKNPQY